MKGLIFTYFLTISGAFVGIFNPFYALCCYISLALLYPPDLWNYSVPIRFIGNIGYSQVVAAGMILGWIFKGFGQWNFGAAKPILYFLVFNLFWMALSSTLNGVLNYGAMDQLQQYLKLYLAFFIGLTLITNVFRLKIFLWIIILSQGFIAYELNMSYMNGFDRLAVIGFGGMDNNFFAVTVVISSILAFGLGLGERSLLLKGLAFFLCVLQMHIVFISMSRGAMLSLFLSSVILFWFIPKKPSTVLIFAFAVVIGSILAGPSVRARFSTVFLDKSERDESAQGRLTSWKNCMQTMFQRPVQGIGLRQWLRYTQENHGMYIEAHSMWMQAGAEQGVPGLFSLIGAFFLAGWKMRRLCSLKTPVPDPFIHAAAQMILASLFGFCLAAQFVSVFGLELAYYVILASCIVLQIQTQFEKELNQDRVIEEI